MLQVFHHGLFCRPMPRGMGNVPSWWKCEVRMTLWGPAFVNDLDRKSPVRYPQKTAVIWRLSLTPTISTRFAPRSFNVHVEEGTTLIPVWSQFKMSSAGISSMVTVATTSFRNTFFCSAKFASLALLLTVVAFLYTNFMRFSSEWDHCLLSSI